MHHAIANHQIKMPAIYLLIDIMLGKKMLEAIGEAPFPHDSVSSTNPEAAKKFNQCCKVLETAPGAGCVLYKCLSNK